MNKTPTIHLIYLVNKLQESHALAREAIAKALIYRKRTYDERTNQTSFDNGDLVYKLSTFVK